MQRPALYRRRRSWFVLAAGYIIAGLLLAPSAFSQDGRKGSWREQLRGDPLYPRLYHDAKAFLAMPEEQQQAMRKLHADLEKLAPAERDWLKNVLRRYVDWLDRQSETTRRVISDAPDARARLRIIKELRDKEWLSHLPKAVRLTVNKLPSARPPIGVAAASTLGLLAGPERGMALLTASATALVDTTDLRAETIARLKKTEARKSRDWMIASRHWDQLTAPNRPELPTRPAEFTSEVENFIKEFLMPVLSQAEKDRLQKAEGKWPLYPLTLVELADKHPMALPQRSGPTNFDSLPQEIQKRFPGKGFAGKKGDKDKKDTEVKEVKKNYDNLIRKKAPPEVVQKRLEAIPVRNPTDAIKFACAAATYIHSAKKAAKMPYELWAARKKDLAAPMVIFLDPQGAFWKNLTAEERDGLEKLEGQGLWPEYPLKIQELAVKYGFRPPWQALPDLPSKIYSWDKFRLKPQNKVEGMLKGPDARDRIALWWRRDELDEAVPRDFAVQAAPWAWDDWLSADRPERTGASQ